MITGFFAPLAVGVLITALILYFGGGDGSDNDWKADE